MPKRRLRYRHAALNLDWLARQISNADRGGSIDATGNITLTLDPDTAKEIALSARMGASLLMAEEAREQNEAASKQANRR